jgi:hypothetical protein
MPPPSGKPGQASFRDFPGTAGFADPAGKVRLGVTARRAGSMKDPYLRDAALSKAGLSGRPAFYLKQIHGAEVIRVTEAEVRQPSPEADGWITNLHGPVLCVFTADCLPIYIWDRAGRAAGVFHAGWRGLAKGMPRAAVKAFDAHFGLKPQDLAAQVGPHIGKCCYRVGPETAEQFRAEVRIERDGGTYLDLGKEAVLQLIESGIRLTTPATECTSCRNEDYFSFRREKSDGRMMAFITLDPK